VRTTARMARVATECVKRPYLPGVWCPENNKYVRKVEQTDAADHGSEAVRPPQDQARTPPPLGTQFKLVFVSAFGGTMFFILLCVLVTLVTGGQPTPLEEELVRGLWDLAKIGFGSVVGILGSKTLK
jgi:hypothetical protein